MRVKSPRPLAPRVDPTHVIHMDNNFGWTLALAAALLAFAPAASAMAFVPPENPTPQCQPTPPGEDPGVIGEVQDVAHDGTTFACSTYVNVRETGDAGYVFGMEVVGIAFGLVGPTVDELQDATCRFLFGHEDGGDQLPPHSRDLCKEVVVRLTTTSSVDLWDYLPSGLPSA